MFGSNRLVRNVLIAALIILFAIGFSLFVVFSLREQKAKLTELNQEKWRLEQRVYELLREQERLQSNLEFVKSEEGRLQYARDYLGYLAPGDIRIEDVK